MGLKKLYIFIILIIVFSEFNVYSQQNKSKIIVYREKNFYGSAISYKLYVNDSLLTSIKNNSFYEYECNHGSYTIRLENNENSMVQINVEQGKYYYFRLIINMGFWSSKPELILVDSSMANKRIINGGLKDLSNIKYNYAFKPLNRIGISTNLGYGIENIPMFSTNTGDNSYISLGGGYGLGIQYGYLLYKNFEIELGFNYQFTSLIPYLKNVRTTSSRGFASITPLYIIPVKGGENMRLKIGVGYSYYWGVKLHIEGSNLSTGFDDYWYYRNASGLNSCIYYNININDKWSLNAGFKYYYVKYSFKSGDNYIPSTDSDLNKPDGSGIDLLIGINYHF